MHALFLKCKKKKTQKGSSYAIVKFSDLSSVFELFIFSDIFEINRNHLIEGNSVMLTLIKSYVDAEKKQKKINIKKVVPLKDVLNKPFEELKLKINSLDELDRLAKLNKSHGKTKITFQMNIDDKICTFALNEKRTIDNMLIKSLKLGENIIN